MAVDTRDKRSSVLGLNTPLFPNPDGAITAVTDRMHIGWSYSGVEAIAGASYGHLVIDSSVIVVSKPSAVMTVSKGSSAEIRTD